jgi:hypothetical protein
MWFAGDEVKRDARLARLRVRVPGERASQVSIGGARRQAARRR